ncbi:MAG: DUF4235 domain-containing protein [Actinobacteria bacterium]|nr:MAG: DUF4235 domain-containing protein [Actinomycetota bacterium]
MTKLLFIPFSVIGGILAGALGKKTFEFLWGVFDDQEAPEPQHRNISLKKLVPALVLQGAIFRGIRGLFDHGARQAFQRLTGSWPGEEQPEQA